MKHRAKKYKRLITRFAVTFEKVDRMRRKKLFAFR